MEKVKKKKLKEKWALDEIVQVLSKTDVGHVQCWLMGFECAKQELLRRSYFFPNHSSRYVKLKDVKNLGEKDVPY